jgi:hypothetical protein
MTEDSKQEDIDQLKIMSDAIYKNFEQLNQLQYQEIMDYTEHKKLTNAPHEILFDITATVMEENEKGEVVGTKELCTKQFHIPVPVDQKYEIFMKTFFMHIEESILNATNQAYSNGEIKDNG